MDDRLIDVYLIVTKHYQSIEYKHTFREVSSPSINANKINRTPTKMPPALKEKQFVSAQALIPSFCYHAFVGFI